MEEQVHDRVQVPVRLEVPTLDRLDRIIWHTGKGRTKQTLLEEAVLDLLDKIEKAENKGKAFPPIPDAQKKAINKRRRSAE